jgi:hypothetical protein
VCIYYSLTPILYLYYVQEALGWIPSLSRFEDDEILRAVNLVVELKGKVTENM